AGNVGAPEPWRGRVRRTPAPAPGAERRQAMRHRDATATVEARLRWRPAPLAYLLAIASAVALFGAVISASWQLVVFAAPMLGVLAGAPWQVSRTRIQVDGGGTQRCFEGEQVTVTIAAFVDQGHALLRCKPVVTDGMTVTVDESSDSGTAPAGLRLTVSAQRWGRYPISVRVKALSPAGMALATVTL